MEPIRWKQPRKRPTHAVGVHGRRPRLELLEERLQPGETILFGISALALWSPASDLLDPPLRAENSECTPRGDSLTASAAHLWAARVPAVDDSVFAAGRTPAIGSELASTGELDDPLAVGAVTRQPAVSQFSIAGTLASAAFLSPGLATKAIAVISSANSREQPFPFLQAEGVTSGTLLFGGTRSVVAELAPGSMRFDASIGQLTIRTDGQDNTVHQTLTRDGFVEVTLGGRVHSSDPASGVFDLDLAGASADTLTAIRFDGSGQDELILDHDQLAGGLVVSAAGVLVKTEDVVAAGPIAIQAQNITVSHALRGSGVALGVSGLLSIEADGKVTANGAEVGGRIDLAADVLVNAGQVHADGLAGGQILVQGRNVLNAGPVTAEGSRGAGGTVQVSFTAAYIDTTAARSSASGVTGPGGHVLITGGATGRLYSSGQQLATGSHGGAVDLFGRAVVLNGGTVDASGTADAGLVRIGGDFHGRNPVVANAQIVTVTGVTTVRANSEASGNGGHIAVWSTGETDLAGSIAAHGGPTAGDGGFIEVSGKRNLNYRGSADAGARHGKTGELLLDPKNIIISAAPAGVFPQFDLIDPHPTLGARFGDRVTGLSTGNVVVANPSDSFGGTNAGAAYLFDGLSGALLSSLVGSNINDRVGSDYTSLGNGNYVVSSPRWNGDRGAVTWGDGRTGVSGVVSAGNSLIGSNPNDSVGTCNLTPCITALTNGNYVVRSPLWNGGRGAATWGDGRIGVRGTLSDANSIVGGSPDDRVGGSGVTLLSNGNYVLPSPAWNGQRGAVTWGNGMTGVRGIISDLNSLVGNHPNDYAGSDYVIPLGNGNYVVGSRQWNGSRGAVTWGNGTTGVSGVISEVNSLVGSDPSDRVGYFIPLNNGNYGVVSIAWNSSRGAATWGNGNTGVRGTISFANSLVGSFPGDRVGTSGTVLSNGNYVVGSYLWNGHRGALTFGNGTTGVSGTISEANSLVGSNPGDEVGSVVHALTNNNYVVQSPSWNDHRGAATWGDSGTGVRGTVSEANSLVGSNPNDLVGNGGVTALSDGNYLVRSPSWNGNRGAATWGDGRLGVRGTVDASNSLIGSTPGDLVSFGFDGVTALSNGNYLVRSPSWNGSRGAATWGDAGTGVRGTVSEANSLVGSNPNDLVGNGGITPLSNGNYVVRSPSWNGNRGAATWGDAGTGIRGTVSEANSLVGSNPNDRVGGGDFFGGVTALSNGNYVVRSPSWNGNRGAATWGDGRTGVRGSVSEGNSLVGSNPNDFVGGGADFGGVAALSNGNYVVRSPSWNGNRGAATWGDGRTGVRGTVSNTNSLVGSNPNDLVGNGDVTPLSNGNYVVLSQFWNGNRGAATWGDGGAGVRGTVSEANSLVGSTPGDFVGLIIPLSDGNYLVQSPSWNDRRGAVTWASGSTGQTFDGRGVITPQNSLVGRAANAGLAGIVLDPIHEAFVGGFLTEGSGRVRVGLTDPNQFAYTRGQAQTVSLTPDFLAATLNTGTAVILQASNDILVNSAITVSASGGGGSLTLQAGRSIVLNADITTDNGNLTLIANDRLANGVVNSQRDPGNAFITMALGTSLNTGTGALSVELRDGAGLTYRDSGAISLTDITAGSATLVNNGPSPGSDIRAGTVTTSGSQSYADANGTTHVFGNLTAQDSDITFNDSVVINDNLTIDAGNSFVTFASSGLQVLTPGNAVHFGNVRHNGPGTLRLAGELSVTGQLINAGGTFDANDQPVTVSRLASITAGSYLAGTAPQTFAGGLTIEGGVFTSSSGPMTIAGPVAVVAGLLSGGGNLDSLTAITGTVAPGSTTDPGILAVAGAVSLFSATDLRFRLNGSTPGSEYSQLRAGGPIFLSNGTLTLLLGFKPDVGTRFEILTSSARPINGTFNGLAEGAIFEQSGLQFQITYQGGAKGNSVVVTRVK